MRLLTVRQVAELLSVPQARAYELARAGMLPVVRVGRQVRVDEDALRKWIASGGCGLSGGRAAAVARP